uniref:phytol kinase n=1 Tax=Ditylum brightwellii TaxID=49249 RepID=A0A7S1ZXN8_9STRA|mmetsp:Transcript_40685/g.60953  ORF Transcript_40685/g.60953 Transcript_40685/m.60953 type:complete len:370 (+) Transcript_40685:123-1232(+)
MKRASLFLTILQLGILTCRIVAFSSRHSPIKYHSSSLQQKQQLSYSSTKRQQHLKFETKENSALLAKNENAPASSKSFTLTKTRKNLLTTTLFAFASTIAAASLHLLQGPFDPISNTVTSYTPSLILRDASTSVLCIILGYALTKIFTTAASDGKLQSRDSRKLIHTLSAPLFVFVWPLFSDAVDARYFAVIVPFLNALRIVIAGTASGSNDGDGDEEELANALSRSGDIKECLGGPLFYVIILSIATFCFWRDNLIGVIAVSTMAAGDGLADLIGRRYGSTNKWSFAPSKSKAGTLAFFVASTVCSILLASWLSYTNVLTLPFSSFPVLAITIAFISAVCAIVEILPLGDDNWTVPACAAVLSFLLFR